MDPLRDQSLIYDRALREEWGVETRLVVYAGYGHMFWTNWPEMEESKRFWTDMVEGMRWLLGQ
jgi:acetyl esterase/lipase